MSRFVVSAIVAGALAVVAGAARVHGTLAIQSPTGTPKFEPRANWAKVPSKWKLGDVSSVAIDEQDHVWIVHRPLTLPEADRASAAPSVLEFDQDGNFLQAWGGAGSGFEWPEREHGIYVDHKGHVWIGGNQCAARIVPGMKQVNDDQLVKFTKAGRFVAQIGRSNMSKGNADMKNLHEPSDVFVYKNTNEAFVADGYGNHRVVVLDADTGAFKRMWGAFGNKPVDNDLCPPPDPGPVANDGSRGPEQFAVVHAIRVSNDGFVYVGDRENKRLQVFTTDGKFVAQAFIARDAVATSRTTGGLAFSADPQQTFLYAAGGRIVVLNRKTLQVVDTNAGPGGHHIATDSKGNIYTASLARGVQKLVFKGVS